MATVGQEQVVDVRLSMEETKALLERLRDQLVADSEHPFGSKDRAVLESIEAKLGAALERANASADRGFTVESADDRRWSYVIKLNDRDFLQAHTGGTGPCWNVKEADDEDAFYLHICELDEMIGALQALRDSEAHRLNVERWSR
jgi:hypothetical protein